MNRPSSLLSGTRRRSPVTRRFLAWEIIAGMLGLLIGTAISFAAAPAHAAAPASGGGQATIWHIDADHGMLPRS